MSAIKPPAQVPGLSPKRRQLPKIIKPNVEPKKGRRLIDSQLGSRPTSARNVEEAKTEITKLKVESIAPQEIEEQIVREPPTSRSASILNYIPRLKEQNHEIVLDQILGMIKVWNSDSVFEMDFNVYHILTHELFSMVSTIYADFTKEKSNILFKSLAICLRVIPQSDREILDPITKLIYEMSKDEFNDELFIRCGIILKLVQNSFSDLDDISTYSCASLRHIASNVECMHEIIKTDVIVDICKSLQCRTRKKRFQKEKLTFVYQVLGLFVTICEDLPDFDFITKYELPSNILQLILICDFDPLIQNMIAKALSVLVLHIEALDELESEDLMPFATLLRSERLDVAEMAGIALANAMQQSDEITANVVFSDQPLNIHGMFDLLSVTESIDLAVSLMRCISKASSTLQGSEDAYQHITLLFGLLDTPMNEVEEWTPEQMSVANALIALKNLTVNHMERVCVGMRGKMVHLMNYGILDYVLDLMKEMIKCDAGIEACMEVKDVEEIALLVPSLKDLAKKFEK